MKKLPLLVLVVVAIPLLALLPLPLLVLVLHGAEVEGGGRPWQPPLHVAVEQALG